MSHIHATCVLTPIYMTTHDAAFNQEQQINQHEQIAATGAVLDSMMPAAAKTAEETAATTTEQLSQEAAFLAQEIQEKDEEAAATFVEVEADADKDNELSFFSCFLRHVGTFLFCFLFARNFHVSQYHVFYRSANKNVAAKK